MEQSHLDIIARRLQDAADLASAHCVNWPQPCMLEAGQKGLGEGTPCGLFT